MTIARTVETYLQTHGIAFEVLKHPHSSTSLRSAKAAHIEGGCLAKGVLLEDDAGYVVAVVPATHHIKLGTLRSQTGRTIRLATESEIPALFKDCDAGAIPALGAAYGIETIWDESLMDAPDIYLEAGDHEELIHLSREQFQEVMGSAQHGQFSSPMQ